MKTLSEKSFDMTGLFEAELLVRLMLRNWGHPFADDAEFANQLLEGAAEALRSAMAGAQLIEEVPPTSLNFVAAVWYVERCAVEPNGGDIEAADERRAWLEGVRRSLPSCFCDPSDLPPE